MKNIFSHIYTYIMSIYHEAIYHGLECYVLINVALCGKTWTGCHDNGNILRDMHIGHASVLAARVSQL